MQYKNIKDELENVIKSAEGHFLSAYQICQKLENNYPNLWSSLVYAYPSLDPNTPMGEGTGLQYSPASFVANALKYFTANSAISGLRQETLKCEGVNFDGVAPGFTGNIVGIWAIKI
ncbi:MULTISPECIES: hypothetical protein [Shewanella]|uniref:Uncharacterized protein n=1 Tax=Shewanella putrefaciens (strain CN-32 / ATCC BAA-453) TaxID=319224 RepID=A4YA31_SHEPC|nr:MULTISPECIES: hypothetical protein [Shewanella]ABM23693.1 hypothetical protein Sputw3181_0843 [Shewanella sp. W3-18-1]QGS48814.1 hypothetical protein FOB89_07735 [Shewanella putrefaciens]CAD6364055.1 hypothetical protein SHEWT2_00377 [Shewanella hafniensis]